ncbi:MAG TPA: hypothetical protein VM598_06640, partial [Bdellovibrionota bacterium]|nr:hypothetical protein [Bdellovibrionota bacterium]
AAQASDANEPKAAVEYTAEQDAQVREAVKSARERHGGGFRRMAARFKELPIFGIFSELKRAAGESGFVRYGNAMLQTLVSKPAMYETFFFLERSWNYAVYPIRSFLYNPLTLFPGYLMYPELFFKSMARNDPRRPNSERRMTFPSVYNGGTRNILSTAHLLVLEDPEVEARLRAWEERVVDVEWEIQQQASQAALRATIDRMEDSARISELVRGGGIASWDDPRLRTIPREARSFYRAYFTEIFERSMLRFLEGVAADSGVSLPENASPAAVKASLIDSIERLTIAPGQAARIVAEIEAQPSSPERPSLLQVAETRAGASSRFALAPDNIRFEIPSLIRDDKAFGRMRNAHLAFREPNLVVRTVLKQWSSLIVDVPIELVLQLLFFAAASSPELIPVQDQQFSATSWQYLSIPIFKGWLVGRAISTWADGWVAIQQMYRQSNDYGQVPPASESSFLGWYYKQGFRHPSNGLIANWYDANSLILANMKSVLSLMIVTSFMTYGRWDLDLYLAGYALTYMTPRNAIEYKFENALEHASDFYLKDVPEELRRHPEAIRYNLEMKARLRPRFNFIYRLLVENPISYFTAFAQMAYVPAIGPRSLVRTIMGGTTPTVLVERGAEAISTHLDGVPLLPDAVNACRKALTNNYPAYLPGEKPGGGR